jgi:hypothetical protein
MVNAIIFDTGASLAISGHKDDFIGPIVSPKSELGLGLGGMANGLGIAGIGIVKLTFMAGGTELTIHTQY